MVQTLYDKSTRGPSLSQKFSSAAGATANSDFAKGLVEEYTKNKQEEKENKAYKRITGKDLSGLPSNQKVAIAKALISEDPYKEMQQYRLHLDSISKRYNSALREINEEIKNYPQHSQEYKDAVSNKKRLSEERDELLGFSKVVDSQIDEMEEEEEKPIKKKVAFDKSNPEHAKRRDTVLKKTKGDKAKAAAILAEEFD